ncbi:MAG: HlyC/CorC family transporter [Planctomycetota bacterium]|nr:MAG: HlyC/CorC family transporter [Planctomycetota bacterium]
MEPRIWLQLLLFGILILLSAFFSSSETGIFSLTGRDLEKMRRDGNPRIELIERLLSQPRRLIITMLIGNELVNITASVISAALVIEFMGGENKWVNFLIMVPILLLFGEITPKTLAIRHNQAFASFQSQPLEWFARWTSPIRFAVRTVAEFFITLVIGKERSRGNLITEDMVRTLATEAIGEGALDSQEAAYIGRIFDFDTKTVEDVMLPRSAIQFFPVEMPLTEMVTELRRNKFSKVPVYEETRDQVIGVLYARDLLAKDLDDEPLLRGGVRPLLRKPYFVPETKGLPRMFRDFRRKKLSLALAVDEYGGITGLITMEDLLECIFGEIHSPSDETEGALWKEMQAGVYEADGAVELAELNQQLGLTLSGEHAETLAGLLLHHHGELPSIGTAMKINGLACEVLAVDQNRIERIRFRKIAGGEEAEKA